MLFLPFSALLSRQPCDNGFWHWDCCTITPSWEQVLLFHPDLQAWPKEFYNGFNFGLLFFPFGSCWNISPLLLSPVTRGNRPCLVLFTAMLFTLLLSKIISSDFLRAGIKATKTLPGTVLTFWMRLLKHSNHNKNRKTKQHAQADGDKGKATVGVSVLWRQGSLSSKWNKN